MAIAVVEWAEQYRHQNKAAGISVSGGGTTTGIAALLDGTVDVANAGRVMSRLETCQSEIPGAYNKMSK
jgi:phosphate transport system substrate-binding protein